MASMDEPEKFEFARKRGVGIQLAYSGGAALILEHRPIAIA